MNSRIITKPSVYLVGSSQFNFSGLDEYIKGEGLEAIADKLGTPLNRIRQLVEEGDTGYTHEETLPEFGGRFCYKSWSKGRETDEYNANILEDKHGSVLRHTTLNLVITGISRSLSHELVRHGAGADPSQESQRYVDAKKAKAIMPPLLLHYLGGDVECGEAVEWLSDFEDDIEKYNKWQEWYRMSIGDDASLGDVKLQTSALKRANEASRAQLPNCTETKMLWTANLQALRHIIMVRGSDAADLEIRRLAVQLALVCKEVAPTIFADIEIEDGTFGVGNVVGQHWKV